MNVETMQTDRRLQHLIFIGLFLLLQVIFIWRSFYGFNTADEMYFIGCSERIFRGEKILIDEWNPTQQLCSFLLHPIYSLIRTVMGSTEGIVMASRFVYLVYSGVLTLFFYLRFQRRGYASFGPTFLFAIFAPFSICAMSYNSIEFGILPVLLAVLSADMEHSVPEYILCGILMAVIVLANPFAVLMYAGYGLICLIATVRGRRRGTKPEGVLQFRNFLWMTLGAGIILLLFLTFIFQRGTLSEMLANVPHIVGDSEHQEGYLYKTGRYFHLCFKNYKWMFVGLLFVYGATLFDKKRYSHSPVYMILAAVCVVPYLIYYGFVFEHITVNYQMLPLAFWCLEAYFVTEHKEKRLFYGWYLPAMLFTMIVQYATNTGIVTLSVAYGIGIEEHDHEGRVITLEFEDYYLVTVYTPNSQDGLRRLDYRMQWEDDFLAYIKSLDEKKPVIYCGDLNVAHQEIDLKNPKTNRKNAGFTDEERAKMTTVLSSGFVDTFRYFYPNAEGIYSWWSYRFRAREKNAGWRIDYFIVSERLKDRLENASIHTEIFGSDHCPVELDLK